MSNFIHKHNCTKFASFPAGPLALILIQPISIQAQSPISQEQSSFKRQAIVSAEQSDTVISGIVYEVHPKYILKPLKGVTITVYPDTFLKATSDPKGKFIIDIGSQINSLSDSITLNVSYSEFAREAIKIKKSEINNITITIDNSGIISPRKKIYVGGIVIPGRTSVSY